MAATAKPRPVPAHSIGRQTIAVTTANPGAVASLQPRIARLNADRLAQVIEDVFDEFDVAGRTLEIGEITLDLGSMPAQGFEHLAASRLREALRTELAELLPPAKTRQRARQAEAERELGLLAAIEHFLIRGRAPSRGRARHHATLRSLLQQALASDPALLATTLRAIGAGEKTVERLVAEMEPELFARLVRALDPVHATDIVLLASGIVESYRHAPIEKPPALAGFDEPVWHLVLAYLLAEPGTEFNRRQFTTTILEEIARDTGLEFSDVLAVVSAGVEWLGRHRRADTSLVSVLRQIVRIEDREQADAPWQQRKDGPRRDAHWAQAPAEIRRLVEDLSHRVGHPIADLFAPDLPVARARLRSMSAAEVHALVRAIGRVASPDDARQLLASPHPSLVQELVARLDRPTSLLLFRTLVPAAAKRDSPLARSISAQAASLSDPALFYHRLVAAALSGEDFDLSALALAPGADELPGGGSERSDPVERGIIHFLRTGDMRLAERRNWGLDTPGKLDRAVRAFATGSRESCARIVREASGQLQMVETWAADLEQETLAALAETAAPGSAQALTSAAAILTRSAKQAGMSADRIGELVADFWRSQFRDIGELERHAGDPDALIAAFMAKRQTASPGAPREAESRLIEIVLKAGTMMAGPRQDSGESEPETIERLLDTLSRSDAAWLAAWDKAESQWLAPERLLRLVDTASARRAIGKLNDRQFAKLVSILTPAAGTPPIAGAAALCLAAARLSGRKLRSLDASLRARNYVFLLGLAGRRGARSWSRNRMISQFVRRELPHFFKQAGLRTLRGRARFLDAWLREARKLARTANDRRLARALDRMLARSRIAYELLQAQDAKEPMGDSGDRADRKTDGTQQAPQSGRPADGTADREQDAAKEESMDPTEQPLHVDNAGLVLAAPFLGTLFSRAGLLAEDEAGSKSLGDAAAFSRAVHLTQFLVTGGASTAPAQLALNKLLCGGGIDAAVVAEFSPTEEERALCEGLLQSMLAHWPPLSTGTTIEGLQETFLQRDGRLANDGERWTLSVERKTLDVLLDQVSWGFRTIMLPWQSMPIHVEW